MHMVDRIIEDMSMVWCWSLRHAAVAQDLAGRCNTSCCKQPGSVQPKLFEQPQDWVGHVSISTCVLVAVCGTSTRVIYIAGRSGHPYSASWVNWQSTVISSTKLSCRLEHCH